MSAIPPPVAAAPTAERSLKGMAGYSPYGWKGKIGLIVPSTNVANEPEWQQLMPEGVSFHTARALLTGATSQESYDIMARGTERAAQELATAEPDLIVYGCTSGSFMVDREALKQRLQDLAGGIPVTTTSDAVLAAFAALGVRRIALATPYLDLVNEREVGFLAANGLSVVAVQGLQLGSTIEERRLINRVPPEVVFRMARAVDRPDADAIFLSCTALPTLPMIDRIEQSLGKPVVASNPVTLWHALRTLGLPDRIAGCGRLLAEF